MMGVQYGDYLTVLILFVTLGQVSQQEKWRWSGYETQQFSGFNKKGKNPLRLKTNRDDVFVLFYESVTN